MAGGAAALGAFGAMAGRRPDARLTSAQARLIDDATAASVSGRASLNDIEHIVFLMQENRSFDHYFGHGVRGPRLLRKTRPTQVVGGQTYPAFSQYG